MKYDILLIGGNGFVGRVLAAQLQAAGYSVLLPTSHLAAGRELRMLPKLYLEDADVHDFDELQSLCARIHDNGAVINLVGVLHDKPATPYGKVFKACILNFFLICTHSLGRTSEYALLPISGNGQLLRWFFCRRIQFAIFDRTEK